MFPFNLISKTRLLLYGGAIILIASIGYFGWNFVDNKIDEIVSLRETIVENEETIEDLVESLNEQNETIDAMVTNFENVQESIQELNELKSLFKYPEFSYFEMPMVGSSIVKGTSKLKLKKAS